MVNDIKIVSGAAAEVFLVDPFMEISPIDDGGFAGGFSIAKGVLNGTHSKRVNRRSVKSYYIIEGVATLTSLNEVHTIGPGDFAIVKANVEVEIIGEGCKLLIFCAPPFEADDETIFS